MEDTAAGNVRVRAWPTHRKLKRTKEERNLEYAFREAMRTAKQWPPDQQADYRMAVEGTALLPTDLIMMTIYGNAFAIRMDDGRTLYSMVTRAKVSESLDVLSPNVGTILARGEMFWGAVEAGAEGEILVMGPDGMPIWQNVTFPGASAYDFVDTAEGTASTAYTNLATAGPAITLNTGPSVEIELAAYIFKNGAGTGNNGFMGVAVSGATTRAADDNHAITASGFAANSGSSCAATLRLTGLTPGANTFTAKYKVNGQNFGFAWRKMTVRVL